jgi:hypothetical protein
VGIGKESRLPVVQLWCGVPIFRSVPDSKPRVFLSSGTNSRAKGNMGMKAIDQLLPCFGMKRAGEGGGREK